MTMKMQSEVKIIATNQQAWSAFIYEKLCPDLFNLTEWAGGGADKEERLIPLGWVVQDYEDEDGNVETRVIAPTGKTWVLGNCSMGSTQNLYKPPTSSQMPIGLLLLVGGLGLLWFMSSK
jgi:hypothetical protein